MTNRAGNIQLEMKSCQLTCTICQLPEVETWSVLVAPSCALATDDAPDDKKNIGWTPALHAVQWHTAHSDLASLRYSRRDPTMNSSLQDAVLPKPFVAYNEGVRLSLMSIGYLSCLSSGLCTAARFIQGRCALRSLTIFPKQH